MKTITTTKKNSAALWRGFTIVLTLVLLTMMMTTFAFAAEEEAAQATQASESGTATTIEQGVKTGMGKVYGIITAVVVPIAVICLGVGAFQFFFGGERGVEKAKKVALYTLGGVALVYLAPLIVTEVASWFSSNGDSGVFS